MNGQRIIDFFDFKDFEDSDFEEALSDLRNFDVKDDELNLNYIHTHTSED